MNDIWGNMNNGAPNGFGFNRGFAPHYEIIKVNGEAGARSFQMGPNSSIFLADATNPNLIWLVQTDGAGYLTPIPLDVAFHQDKQQIGLENRIKHLEDMYEQLNSRFNKQPKNNKQSKQPIPEQSVDTTT